LLFGLGKKVGPFHLVVGTFCFLHTHLFCPCVAPFMRNRKSKNYVERTLEISLVAKNDFYVVVIPCAYIWYF
jgi:hypothetical protein